jgi:hypothetical protein
VEVAEATSGLEPFDSFEVGVRDETVVLAAMESLDVRRLGGCDRP